MCITTKLFCALTGSLPSSLTLTLPHSGWSLLHTGLER
jgi:hypothetical protein